jgi:hypothetical protein
VEITILPAQDNNPEADTPADVIQRLETNSQDEDIVQAAGMPASSDFSFSTNRPSDLPPVNDDTGEEFPLVFVLLGILGLVLVLITVYAWRKFIQRRYALRNANVSSSGVKLNADGSVVVHKIRADMADSRADTPSTTQNDSYITPRDVLTIHEQRVSIDEHSNDINVPIAAPVIAASGSRYSVLAKPVDTAAEDDFEY